MFVRFHFIETEPREELVSFSARERKGYLLVFRAIGELVIRFRVVLDVAPLNLHQDSAEGPAGHLLHLEEEPLSPPIHVVSLLELPDDGGHQQQSEEAPVRCHVISNLQISTA